MTPAAAPHATRTVFATDTDPLIVSADETVAVAVLQLPPVNRNAPVSIVKAPAPWIANEPLCVHTVLMARVWDAITVAAPVPLSRHVPLDGPTVSVSAPPLIVTAPEPVTDRPPVPTVVVWLTANTPPLTDTSPFSVVAPAVTENVPPVTVTVGANAVCAVATRASPPLTVSGPVRLETTAFSTNKPADTCTWPAPLRPAVDSTLNVPGPKLTTADAAPSAMPPVVAFAVPPPLTVSDCDALTITEPVPLTISAPDTVLDAATVAVPVATVRPPASVEPPRSDNVAPAAAFTVTSLLNCVPAAVAATVSVPPVTAHAGSKPG